MRELEIDRADLREKNESKRVQVAMKMLDYISPDNIGQAMYDNLSRLKDILRDPDNTNTILNSKRVTGVWCNTTIYNAEYKNMPLQPDEKFKAPTLIVRSDINFNSRDLITINGELYHNGIDNSAYIDYNESVVLQDKILSGFTDAIRQDIFDGNVFTIYDTERGD